MIHRMITLPERKDRADIATHFVIAGTRVALGAGIGLLLADRLNDDQRRAVGWTLLAVGALTTVPLAAEVLLRHEPGAGPRPDPYAAGVVS